MPIEYRLILPKDNRELAAVIRTVLKEHKLDKDGTVFTDPTTDDLYQLFQKEKSVYWLAIDDGEIIGGCGIYPTNGLPENYAELVKLYVLTKARNKGVGHHLMELCFQTAISMDYKFLYLETLPELGKAISLYERKGFKSLSNSLGSSGHFACNIWMLKEF